MNCKIKFSFRKHQFNILKPILIQITNDLFREKKVIKHLGGLHKFCKILISTWKLIYNFVKFTVRIVPQTGRLTLFKIERMSAEYPSLNSHSLSFFNVIMQCSYNNNAAVFKAQPHTPFFQTATLGKFATQTFCTHFHVIRQNTRKVWTQRSGLHKWNDFLRLPSSFPREMGISCE